MNKKIVTKMTREEIFNRDGVPIPTPEEEKLLDEFYTPLRKGVPPNTMVGSNVKGYCHYEHCRGHYTRNCPNYCPYCKTAGHGWQPCTNPMFKQYVEKRLAFSTTAVLAV